MSLYPPFHVAMLSLLRDETVIHVETMKSISKVKAKATS